MIQVIKFEIWLLEDDGGIVDLWHQSLPPGFTLQVYGRVTELKSALARRQAEGIGLPAWLVFDRFMGDGDDTVGEAYGKRIREQFAYDGKILLSSDLPAPKQDLVDAGFDGQIKKSILNSGNLAKILRPT